MKYEIFIELHNKKISDKEIATKVKEAWVAEGNKVKDISSAEIYYKPDEGKCYYVINGTINGEISV